MLLIESGRRSRLENGVGTYMVYAQKHELRVAVDLRSIADAHRFFPPLQHIFEPREHTTTFEAVFLNLGFSSRTRRGSSGE
jgi:hypothetical protein